MSVHRSGNGGSSGLSYADHDVHWVRHGLEYESTADAGPTVTENDIRQFEITSRGLEPDELAELRVLTVDASLRLGDEPVEQDEIGGFAVNFDYGYNLSGTEFLSVDVDTEGIDSDDSGTDDFQALFRDTDEVGQLGSHVLSTYAGYSDTTDGTGGAAGCPRLRFTMNYGDMFGSGPIVDSVDDFSSRILLSVENMVAGAFVDVRYGLFYRVEESETGRTRFGR